MTVTAEEHYAEAEELLSAAKDPRVPMMYLDKLIARAQVHATLACAAALLSSGDRGTQTRSQPRTE